MTKKRRPTEEPIDRAPPGWTDERKKYLLQILKVSRAQLDALIENLSLLPTVTEPGSRDTKTDRMDLIEGLVEGLAHAVTVLKPLVEAKRGSAQRSKIFDELMTAKSEDEYTPDQLARVAVSHQFDQDKRKYLDLYDRLEHDIEPLEWDETAKRVLNIRATYVLLKFLLRKSKRENARVNKTTQSRIKAQNDWVYEVDLSLKSGFLHDIGYGKLSIYSEDARTILFNNREYKFPVSSSRTSAFYHVCMLCREVLDGPKRDGPEAAIRAYRDRLKSGSFLFPVPQ